VLLPRVQKSIDKPVRLCVGVLSGTSVDAAEAALCRIEGTGARVKLSLLAHASLPFEASLVHRVLGAESAAELSQLNFLLAEKFADAALEVIHRAGLSPSEVDVVGSHGQTFAHLPRPALPPSSTLQLGEGAVIAERTGIPTVSDFRTRDMAVGGQGAPLVPYFDWAVLRLPNGCRAFQNLGGIANVSVVTDDLSQTMAFDTGPANMVLDELAKRATDNKLWCDMDGTLSARGQTLQPLLEELLSHPFLSRPPPKSTGREEFGEALVEGLWRRFSERPYDLIATALSFTVEATARAYESYVLPRFTPEAVYLSGGGCRNPRLLEGLSRRLAPLPVRPLLALGFPEAAKEAACFALLANEFLSGTPQNVPSATGAKKAVLLGKLSP
jgi:anhydro-N-acetylmuramic acid kinase